MSNPQKAQGTREETRVTRDHNSIDGITAWRLAEQGTNDPGDVAVHLESTGDHIILECKHRDRLNIHQTVQKAKKKAETADLPFIPTLTAVVWHRTIRVAGERGVPAGTVVCLDYEDWLELVSWLQELGEGVD